MNNIRKKTQKSPCFLPDSSLPGCLLETEEAACRLSLARVSALFTNKTGSVCWTDIVYRMINPENPTDPIVADLEKSLKAMQQLQAVKPCPEMRKNIVITEVLISNFHKALRRHYAIV